MKPTTLIRLLAVATAVLLAPSMALFAQAAESNQAPLNPAFAASPRAKEAYPWLTRVATVRNDRDTRSAGSVIKQHRSLATSPRILEQYPELTRLQSSPVRSDAASRTVADSVLRTSPRARGLSPGRHETNAPVSRH